MGTIVWFPYLQLAPKKDIVARNRGGHRKSNLLKTPDGISGTEVYLSWWNTAVANFMTGDGVYLFENDVNATIYEAITESVDKSHES